MKTAGKILILFLSIPIFAEPQNPAQIPNIPLYTLDLQRKTLYQELDRLQESDIVIVNFTSSNCVPCKIEVPHLLEYSKKWNSSHKQNRLLLWIVFLEDDADTASKFASSLGIQNKSSVYFDRLSTSMRILDFPGTPTTFVIRNRNILFKEFGYTDQNWNKMVSLLEKQR